MRKKTNLILSFASLVVTAFLLVALIFSWYVTNNSATAKGIIATAEGINGSFDFYYWLDNSTYTYSLTEDTTFQSGKEYYKRTGGAGTEQSPYTYSKANVTVGATVTASTYYEKNKTLNGTWELSNNSLKINDAWPDEIFYFKIVGSGLVAGDKLSIKFGKVSTSIDTTVVSGGYNGTTSKYEVSYYDSPQYTSSTNEINVNMNNESKTLYELSAGSYSVTSDTEYQEGKLYYSRTGAGTDASPYVYSLASVTEGDSVTGLYEADGYSVDLKDVLIEDVFRIYTAPTIDSTSGMPTGKGNTNIPITSSIFNQTLTQATVTIYFALSFSGGTYDNYYMFQALNVEQINIDLQ